MKVLQFHIIIVLLLTFNFISSCSSQEASLKINEDHKVTEAKNYTQEDSKDKSTPIAAHILSIIEDSNGDFWFGTYDHGVAKYDGESLEFFTEKDGLCGKTVSNITEDKEGQLWFGTYSDMCRLDLKTTKSNDTPEFISFEKDNQGVPFLGHGWKRVHTDQEGQLWMNSHHGIYQYINGEFVKFDAPMDSEVDGSFCNSPGSISMDLKDSQGNLWFGTDHQGAYKFDGIEFTHYTMGDGLLSNSIMDINEDKDGNIWFACVHALNSNESDGAGLTMYDSEKFIVFPEKEGLFGANVHHIFKDSKNNLWIGAPKVGVYKYDGDSFTLYPEPAAVDHSSTFIVSGLQSFLEDSRGRIWMGFSGGLYRLENGEFIHITQDGPW